MTGYKQDQFRYTLSQLVLFVGISGHIEETSVFSPSVSTLMDVFALPFTLFLVVFSIFTQ